MAKKNERDTNTLGELKQHLKMKEPGRLYVFHGEEVFLLNHYLGQIKKILLDELTESFNYTRLTNETFELQMFADAVEAMPMMAETTFVQVDDVDFFKLPEAERNKIGEILADIPDWCTVLFTYETVTWKPDKRYKKLWEGGKCPHRGIQEAGSAGSGGLDPAPLCCPQETDSRGAGGISD